MRIADLSPLVTEWRNGRTMTASSWRSVDDVDAWGDCRRRVWHYETLMVEFVFMEDMEAWASGAMSVGHGSVSDANGVNALWAATGSPFRMRRDAKGGGPRVVNTLYGNLVAVADGSDSRAWEVNA